MVIYLDFKEIHFQNREIRHLSLGQSRAEAWLVSWHSIPLGKSGGPWCLPPRTMALSLHRSQSGALQRLPGCLPLSLLTRIPALVSAAPPCPAHNPLRAESSSVPFHLRPATSEVLFSLSPAPGSIPANGQSNLPSPRPRQPFHLRGGDLDLREHAPSYQILRPAPHWWAVPQPQ